MQERFDWKGVAGAAVGAGVGYQVGQWLGPNLEAGKAIPGTESLASWGQSGGQCGG
jgi:hypothetical protein